MGRKLTDKQIEFSKRYSSGEYDVISGLGLDLITKSNSNIYYVYQLSDPISSEVFYVGKGIGKRVHFHETETTGNMAKINKISSIVTNGMTVKKEIIFTTHVESEAFDFEVGVIDSIGLENLTNIQPGGGKGSNLSFNYQTVSEMIHCLLSMPKPNEVPENDELRRSISASFWINDADLIMSGMASNGRKALADYISDWIDVNGNFSTRISL